MKSTSVQSSAVRRECQAGFSLIELMIAIVLGALVVAGLINVLMANRQAYHLQEANNYNQQNMRFAMDRIGWSLRMSSFWGGITPLQVSGTPAVSGITGSCDKGWALDVTKPVYGYDGAATFPIKDCVPGGNYVSGSDVLVVRYADTDAIAPATALTTGQIFLQTRAGTRGVLFAGDGSNKRPSELPFVDASGNTVSGTYTYPYAIEMYYLRPCSDLGGASTCSAASDGGHPIPTLMRMRLDSTGTLINEPVVEGIEQLQFEYGVRDATDPTQNPAPTQYKDATAMSATDWGNVTAVRIGYVLRSQTRDTAVPHSFDSHSITSTDTDYPLRLSADCQYKIAADGTPTVTSKSCIGFDTATALGDKPQQYTRAEMTAVVQVRNPIRQISP